MDAEPEAVDVRSQVFQSTLDEISSCAQRDTAECCVICLDTICDPSIAHPCGHTNFDFLCLVNWLQLYPTCPLCKSDVSEVRYGLSTPEDGRETNAKIYRVPQHDRKVSNGAATSEARPGDTETQNSSSSQRTFEHYFLGRHRATRTQRPQGRPHPNPAAPRPTPTHDEAIRRRRYVYRNQLYSLHVGSNRISRYRELTPELFASDPHLVSRARQWIRRELQVFEFLYPSFSAADAPSSSSASSSSTHSNSGHPTQPATADEHRGRGRGAGNAEFLLEYTIAILKTVDTRGSAGQAEAMLADFLGRDATRLFLHELRGWLRSPHGSLEAWDRAVQYPEPKPSSSDLDHDPDTDYAASRGRRKGSRRDGFSEPRSGGGRDIGNREPRDFGRRVGGGGNGSGKGDYWRPGKKRRERRGWTEWLSKSGAELTPEDTRRWAPD